jgi:EAL domain-containing protein (putative c-di-GMP-specific phosphodiesterase class I)
MNSDERNQIIVRSTIELARNLGLRTVAEGIENDSTLGQVRELGCELGQGFFISRPMPALELVRWWDGHTRGEPMPDEALAETMSLDRHWRLA